MKSFLKTIRMSWLVFGRALRTPGLMVVLIAVGVYNAVLQAPAVQTRVLDPNWVFGGVLVDLANMLAMPPIIGLILIFWVAKLAINVIVAYQMYRASLGQRAPFARVYATVKSPRVLGWYACCSIALFLAVSSAAALLWLPLRLAWQQFHLDLIVVLAVVGVVGYPLYIAWSATASLIAVLPIATSVKSQLMRSVLSPNFGRQIYLYYFGQIGLEAVLVVAVTYAALKFANPTPATHVLGSVLLVIPLLLLRSASYTRTVNTLVRLTGAQSAFHGWGEHSDAAN